MKKHFITSALVGIGGFGIGIVVGFKGTLAYIRAYIQTDEAQSYVSEELDKVFDEFIKEKQVKN